MVSLRGATPFVWTAPVAPKPAAAAPAIAPAALPQVPHGPVSAPHNRPALAADPIAAAALAPLRLAAQLGAPAANASAPHSFFDLPSELQGQIRDRMRPFVGQPDVLRRYANLVTSDAFVGAPRDAQLAAADALAKCPNDPTLSKDLARLLGNANTKALDPSVQAELARAFATPGMDRVSREGLAGFANVPGFKALSPARQSELIRGAAANPSASDPLLFLIGNKGFGALPEQTQAKAIAATAQTGASDDVRNANDRLTQTPEFALLSADAQGRWLDALGHSDPATRDRAAARANEWLDKPGYQARTDAERALILTKISRGAGLPETVDAQPGDYDRFQTHGKLTGGRTGTSSAFESGPAEPARTYTVTIDKQAIKVIVPVTTDPAGGHYPSEQEIKDALERMPASSRKELKRIVVEPRADESAGARARSAGTISIYPSDPARSRDELTSVMIHETGHLLGDRSWGPLKDHGQGWQGWERAVAKDDQWPSSYATHSPHEDLAETMVLYQRVHGTADEAAWRAKMPERFAILDSIVK